MQLKYDLYTINNAMGSGKSRRYVRLILREPLTARELEAAIEKRCSLTKGDVAAVLTELRDLCVQAFIEGRRFYIPEIGYFSLAASLNVDDNNADRKVTGNDVRIAGINFRPEASLVKEVSQGVRFVRTKNSNQSSQYTEQQMSEQVRAYLKEHNYITCKIMRTQFGLTQYLAQKWLNRLCNAGVIAKEGVLRFPLYVLK